MVVWVDSADTMTSLNWLSRVSIKRLSLKSPSPRSPKTKKNTDECSYSMLFLFYCPSLHPSPPSGGYHHGSHSIRAPRCESNVSRVKVAVVKCRRGWRGWMGHWMLFRKFSATQSLEVDWGTHVLFFCFVPPQKAGKEWSSKAKHD